LSQRPRYWQISAIEDYINQVIQLPIDNQNNIQNMWIEVSHHEDPRDVGSWDDCGTDDKDCPFIVVIFEGLPFEFMYEMDKDNEKLTLIDCYPLDIFHPQEE